MGFNSNAGTLKVTDGSKQTQLSTKASIFEGFRWIEVFTNVSQAKRITIEQQDSVGTYSNIDAVALVPNNVLSQARAETNQMLNSVLHRVNFISAVNPNLLLSEFQQLENRNSTNQYVLSSSGPSKLSIPFVASEGDNYVYVRHGASPTNGASFSIDVNNDTDLSWSFASNATATVTLSASGWTPGVSSDMVGSFNTENYGSVINWELSDQAFHSYLYSQTSLNLEGNNYAAFRVFGDGSGNGLGAYFYDAANHWVYYQLTPPEGLNWKGWGEVVIDLDSVDSTSGGFNWSNVTRTTIEYIHNPNNPPSEIVMFTPYGFYRIQESQSDFIWSKLGPFRSQAGEANLELSANGPLTIDSILISDVSEMASISDLFWSSSSILENVSQLTQTEFRLKMEMSNRSIVIFKQSYHPLWQASSGVHSLHHITINFAFNGFIIDDESKETLHIWYEGDHLLAWGTWISAISLGLVIIIALTMTIKNRGIASTGENRKRKERRSCDTKFEVFAA